jgi:O-antigen biosynthesis protein
MSRSLSAARQTAGTPGRLTLARQEVPEEGDPLSPRILQLVGEGKRVLALGQAPAELLRGLHEQGCEVGSVQPDTAEVGSALGEESFDVIVAVRALEHLRDPQALLEGLKKQLGPDGYLIAAVPNVAHGNVRLALLGGRFPFGEEGRLEAAPLRFFTYDSLVSLFESAGYAVGTVERQQEEVNAPEGDAPAEVVESVARAPEARTARFLAVACPVPSPSAGWLQLRLRQLAEQHAAAAQELDAVREDLQAANSHLRILVEQQQASLAREKELRARLEEGQDELERREQQSQAKLQEAAAQLLRQEEEIGNLRGKLWEAGEQLKWREQRYAELHAERDALEARLGRFRNSLPGRLLRLVRRALGRKRGQGD